MRDTTLTVAQYNRMMLLMKETVTATLTDSFGYDARLVRTIVQHAEWEVQKHDDGINIEG